MDKFINRSSCRKYQKYDLTKQEIEDISNVINCSPTSINGQHFSCLLITNQELKNQLANMNMFQSHIADCSIFAIFLLDLTSVKQTFNVKKTEVNEDMIDNIIISSIVDAIISATMLQDYALINDFGTCWIGAIRHNISKIRKILNLPNYIFPIVGLTIGKATTQHDIKPKLNKVFINKYDNKDLISRMDKYEITMDKYYKNKYPEIQSRAFYGQIESFYMKNSNYLSEFDFKELSKMISNIFFKQYFSNK